MGRSTSPATARITRTRAIYSGILRMTDLPRTGGYFRDRTTEQNLTTSAPWTSPRLPTSYRQDSWPGA